MRVMIGICILAMSQEAAASEAKTSKARPQSKAAAVVAKAKTAPQASVGSLLFVQTEQQELQLQPVAAHSRRAPTTSSLAQALRVMRDHELDAQMVGNHVYVEQR